MALYNRYDGTLYSAETIAEMLDARFDKEDVPYVGDILGSDWRCNPGLPCDYRAAAYEMARRIYDDEGGHLHY